MERREYAIVLKHDHRNCCQAVLSAYREELGLPEDKLYRMGDAFGLGMGTMEGTCGALCGAELALSIMEGGEPSVRSRAAELLKVFKEKAGATQCRELKGVDAGRALCSCDDCVRFAVDALEAVRKKD